MIHELKYGKSKISFELPESTSVQVLQAPLEDSRTTDETQLVNEALDAPLNSLPLEKIVRKGESTCIVVPDRTRTCRASVFLPLILKRLNQCGIADEDIAIIMANGTHRQNTSAEEIEILGKEVVRRIQVIEHDCHDSSTLVHLGETQYGNPIYINRALIRAERLILTGGVLHHYFAGFGGGPKLVFPGCAGYETIRHNHRFTIHPFFPTLHPGCQEGNMVDNPVQQDIRDGLKFVSVDFTLNVVTDSRGLISAAFAGELFAAHEAVCAAVHRLHSINFDRKSGLVIASGAGYPKDLNLIQVHKAIHHAFEVLQENGVLILLAQCPDGIGSKTFEEWFDDAPEIKTMHHNLLNHFKINGNTALALKMKTEAAKIILVSDMDDQLIRKFGMIPAKTIEDALHVARKYLPSSYHTTIFPNAATYLPQNQQALHKLTEGQKQTLIKRAIELTKERTKTDYSGHDWWHAWRVRKIACYLAEIEGGDRLVIELAALLHDIEDWEKIEIQKTTPKTLVRDWLRLQRIPIAQIDHICEIISTISFRGAGVSNQIRTLEGKIVQDADRLDAIGAVGIARTFAYGAVNRRPIYEPDLTVKYHQTPEEYLSDHGTSINHFYEKLLLLHERFNTETAKKIGMKRHQFLTTFLDRFFQEWNGEDYKSTALE